MKQKEILEGLAKGGRIINKIYVNTDNTVGDTVTDRQIKALKRKGVQQQTHYDNTRTYRLPE